MSVDAELRSAIRRVWKKGNHVGEDKPVLRGYVRTVRIRRRARVVDPSDVYSHVPGWEGANTIWQGRWQNQFGWKKLPNILSVEAEQDFEQNGVQSATIDIDNVDMKSESGVEGIYHVIERGNYSPFRGYRPKIGLGQAGDKNAWFDVLSDKSSQIILVAGYGELVVPVFEGLVNDLDMTSHPDKMTITARDGGQLLTDQHVYVNAKIRAIKDPITFADRKRANRQTELAYGAFASDSHPGHPARFAVDERQDTEWVSNDRENDHPANLPFIEVGVPNGRYAEIRLHPRYSGMTAFVCVQAKDKHAPGGGASKAMMNIPYSNGEWIAEGVGNTVPGTSIPYVKKVENVKAKARTIALPDYGYDLGDDSKVRIYFTNLDRGKSATGKSIVFRAGVIEMQVVRSQLRQEARQDKWILVDDLADVVRTVFQWAGLNDWEVETTGVRLKENATFNRGNYLIDIINAASDQVGYAFHMRPRDEFDEDDLDSEQEEMSMGVAVWRQTNALHKGGAVRGPTEVIHEDQTLLGINVKWTDEPLAYNIRIRGREKNRNLGGRIDNGDDTARVMYVYRPPWSRDNDYRNANIKKYVVHHDEGIKTEAEAKVAALFIAFREALEAGQAQFEAPAMPTISLDEQAAIFDHGTGLSTRVYVASKRLSYQGGEQGHFRMALGGPLLDLPDVSKVREELIGVLRNNGMDPGLSEWEKNRDGNEYHDV